MIFFSSCFPGCVGSFYGAQRCRGLSASKGRDQRAGEGRVLASKQQAGLAGVRAKPFGNQVLVWPGTEPGESRGLRVGD